MTVAVWEGSDVICDCLIRNSSILSQFHGTHRYTLAIVVFRFLTGKAAATNVLYISRHSKPEDIFRRESRLRLSLDIVDRGLPQALFDVGGGVPQFWFGSITFLNLFLFVTFRNCTTSTLHHRSS